jgi:hypothetical protein
MRRGKKRGVGTSRAAPSSSCGAVTGRGDACQVGQAPAHISDAPAHGDVSAKGFADSTGCLLFASLHPIRGNLPRPLTLSLILSLTASLTVTFLTPLLTHLDQRVHQGTQLRLPGVSPQHTRPQLKCVDALPGVDLWWDSQ